MRLDCGENVHNSFLVGKAKVAPVKQNHYPSSHSSNGQAEGMLQWKVEKSIFLADSTTLHK